MISANAPRRGGDERYRQLRRILAAGEVLRSYRFGVTAEFLNREVNERIGETWHLRTTARDLAFMESCGMVTANDSRRWQWRDARPLAEQRPEQVAARG